MSDSNYGEYFAAPGNEPHSPAVSRSEILTIGRKKWLIGMRWRSYEVLPDREELAEEAATMNTNWIARRVGDEAIQVGFCAELTESWPSGVHSLAALLADSHKVPWAGAFELGDGLWWYIAVRDNFGMMPGGDVVGTFDDIQRARAEHASLEDFNHVNGTRAQLEALIAQCKAKRTPVESLTASRITPRMMLGALGVIACAAALYMGYQHYGHVKAEEQMKVLRAQLLENARKTLIESTPDAATILRSIPDPDVWLNACRQAVYSRPLWQCGWQLVSQDCEGPQLMLSWKRGPGATIGCAPSGVIADDGNSVSQVLPLPLPAGPGSDDAVPINHARASLMHWAQAHDISVSMTNAPVAPPESEATKAAVAALGASMPKPVPSIQISFSVPAAPFALDFSGVPGLRLNGARLADVAAKAGEGADWKVSGVVYGR